ncbi:MAG: hypothetical protein D6704_09750, partial [Nitrospirae bacterium]
MQASLRFKKTLWHKGVFSLVGAVVWILTVSHQAQASCGAVTCFLVIGSQAGVPQKGILTLNMIYNYIDQDNLLDGTTGIIPAVEVDDRELVLNDHREILTFSQVVTMDLNIGLTDRFALQITIPTVIRDHRHEVEQGTPDSTILRFTDTGLGDIRLIGKYNILP